jgi:hypothetical protein
MDFARHLQISISCLSIIFMALHCTMASPSQKPVVEGAGCKCFSKHTLGGRTVIETAVLVVFHAPQAAQVTGSEFVTEVTIG